MTSYIARRINAVIADMDAVQPCTCLDCTGAACACTETTLCLFHQMEEDATQAQQEALTDDTCYCDDVDMCPPCARSYAAYCKEQEQRLLAGYGDTTPVVKLTPEQQALFDAELPF